MRHYPDSYYAATANSTPARAPLRGEYHADVCVIGAGFTGISAALHLSELGYRTTVLESDRVGWGASGRNGGQVGSGQRQDVFYLEKQFGIERARTLWALAEEAKAIVRDRINVHNIKCDYQAGNLMAVTKRRYLTSIAEETERLAEGYGYHALDLLDREGIRNVIASEQYVGGRMDHGGGHLHPLNFLLGMAEAAAVAGAVIHEASAVRKIAWGNTTRVETDHGAVVARHVLVCANGYLDDSAIDVDVRMQWRTMVHRIMPITNHVLATERLSPERVSALITNGACVHTTKFVVDYYRCSGDGRLIFGGGETYSAKPMPDVKAFVRRYMLDVFPQLHDAEIEYGWSGKLAISMNRLPQFGRVGSNGLFALGFSGHGVALTQLAGKLMAEVVAGRAERFDVMAALRSTPFPGGSWFRQPLLVLGMLYYALRDRL